MEVWQIQVDSDEDLEEFINHFPDETCDEFIVYWMCLPFTHHVLILFDELLNMPLPQQNDGSISKWSLHCCDLPKILQDTNDEDSCTEEDISRFASTLCNRVNCLFLKNSPGIIECLSRVPQWEIPVLRIEDEINNFPLEDYVTLSNLVKESTKLKKLDLFLGSQIPNEALDFLLNTRYLHSLSIQRLVNGDEGNRQIFSKLVAGEGGHQPVTQLLQDPNSQLKFLDLSRMRLVDDDFIALTHILPTTRLEELDVSCNYIGAPGILEFARHLPTIKCLKKVRLFYNEWDKKESDQDLCGAAVFQGMKKNTSIEGMGGRFGPQVIHQCMLNRARKIITANPSIPLGLWPRILERAEEFTNYHDGYDEKWWANIIYFFLQNVPIFQWRQKKT